MNRTYTTIINLCYYISQSELQQAKKKKKVSYRFREGEAHKGSVEKATSKDM